jgi:hypothetical protein
LPGNRSPRSLNVEIMAHARIPNVAEYQRTHLLSLIEPMRERILASGRLTEVELRTHIEALSEHLSDPATTLIDKLISQAWGQKLS